MAKVSARLSPEAWFSKHENTKPASPPPGGNKYWSNSSYPAEKNNKNQKKFLPNHIQTPETWSWILRHHGIRCRVDEPLITN